MVSLLCPLCATGQFLFPTGHSMQGPTEFCLVTPLVVFKHGHGGTREDLPWHNSALPPFCGTRLNNTTVSPVAD